MSKDKFDRDEVIKALELKGANKPCQRCGNNSFAVIDGYSRYSLSESHTVNSLGGNGVPVVLIACNNCGAITTHAALALLDLNEKKGAKNGK